MSIADWIWPLFSALVGGFIGGWTVAFRLGSWRQRVEDKIDYIEDRLRRGDAPVNEVPVLAARLDALKASLDGVALTLRNELPRLVSREECDRRHERNA